MARNLGAVYTPPPVAGWLARELVRRLPPGARRVVVDPACGDGALLEAVGGVDPGARLIGIDIDRRAVTAPSARVEAAETAHRDALTAPWCDDAAPGGVIANPPWGADLEHSRSGLAAAGYVLATGQFDSYELFVERAIDQLPEGSVAAFLVPDSLLLPEHQRLRRLLAERTSLELVVRLGEGIFDGVYRGTVAIVFRIGPPRARHTVRCCRLRDADRRRLLAGDVLLETVVTAQGHDVLQSHFAKPDAAFDVDVSEVERATLDRMSGAPSVWSAWLRPFRGVEIGKSGATVVCPACGAHRPVPRGDGHCPGCGAAMSALAVTVPIIRDGCTGAPGWRPVVVGEDVGRYSVRVRREIRLGVPGINYKPAAIFASRKLLVRKTGVGIHAAIDDTGALTTQTVFHFLPTTVAPDFALHYALGVLCSRVVLAYHLKRSGDDEWRSHPYVTPKTLVALPLPLPVRGTRQWRQAVAVADAVGELITAPAADRDALDLRVERLVAGLFGFDVRECRWVEDVLGRAQQLRAIAAVRLPSPDALYPVVVP